MAVRYFNSNIPDGAHERFGELEAAGAAVAAFAMTGDGGWLVVGDDASLHSVDVPVDIETAINSLTASGHTISCVACSDGGSRWVVCSDAGALHDGSSTELAASIDNFEVDGTTVRWAAFDDDGWVLCTADGRAEARGIDDNCYQAIRNLSQSAIIDVVAFDGDGGWLVIAGPFVDGDGLDQTYRDQAETFVAEGDGIAGVAFGSSATSWSVWSSDSVPIVDDPLRRLDGWYGIRTRQLKMSAPGVSVAVVQDGQVSRTSAYGWLALNGQQAAHPESLFQAASVSKLINCLGILRLVDDGTIALDDAVEPHLSWTLPNTFGQSPTFRQLLYHSGGVNVSSFGGYPSGTTVPTLRQILNGAGPTTSAPIQVTNTPGSTYSYSGGGSTLLQRAIQQITGELYSQWMYDNVLEPLGMVTSTFEIGPPTALIPAEGVADGHLPGQVVVVGGRNSYPESAAAGLYTSALELCRVIMMVNAGGTIDGVSFLPTPLITEMLTALSINGVSQNVGLGCSLPIRFGDVCWSHGGGNVGFKCKIFGLPAINAGFVVMTNGNYEAFREQIVETILDTYGW